MAENPQVDEPAYQLCCMSWLILVLGDLLPFPVSRSLGEFPEPPREEWNLRKVEVRLADIEYVTETFPKVDISRVLFGIREEIATIENELKALAADWRRSEWTEFDWFKISDLDFRENLGYRNRKLLEVQKLECISCPNFLSHVRPVTLLVE